jgi:hypothetical protein
MSATASNLVERKGGRVKVGIAVPEHLLYVEYSILWSIVKRHSLAGHLRRSGETNLATEKVEAREYIEHSARADNA